MADHTTFIKIDRNITEWRWFKDAKVFQVFSWLLIKANIKDHDFRNYKVKRGSLATSYESIANCCGMSVSSVRRVIASLEETKEIERTVRDHYQIITILNYDEYQGKPKGVQNKHQNEQPLEQPLEQANGNNQRIYKNDKNGKNDKEIYVASLTLPCGAKKKPRWMDDETWDRIKYRTVEDIPGIEQGFYDTYIEYANDIHKQGRVIT